mmetsp:Transcript_19157/g.67639  ORF Transcript_19157/g.67639 Transcript_19157/m.67639 type:complete len:324 (-) Transcript_19157:401-1372(-)
MVEGERRADDVADEELDVRLHQLPRRQRLARRRQVAHAQHGDAVGDEAARGAVPQQPDLRLEQRQRRAVDERLGERHQLVLHHLRVAVPRKQAAHHLHHPLLRLPPRPRHARIDVCGLPDGLEALAGLGQRLGEQRIEHVEPHEERLAVRQHARQQVLRAAPEVLDDQLHVRGRLERVQVEEVRKGLLQQRERLLDDHVERRARLALAVLVHLGDVAKLQQRVVHAARFAAPHVLQQLARHLLPRVRVHLLAHVGGRVAQRAADRFDALHHHHVDHSAEHVGAVLVAEPHVVLRQRCPVRLDGVLQLQRRGQPRRLGARVVLA